jgi:hypothetical protein
MADSEDVVRSAVPGGLTIRNSDRGGAIAVLALPARDALVPA